MTHPNIIYLFADDMGYGDMRCNNLASKIPTPHLDRLARSGMRFTDAHAASAVCTPSRYSLLTGRYAWRSRLKQGIVWEWDGALIEPNRCTVAGMLRDRGYRTACIGKWHLGLDWPTRNGRHPNETLEFGVGASREIRTAFSEQIDFGGEIRGGPVDHGFDSYFGIDTPNFPPYTWFEDRRVTPLPSTQKPESMYGHPGPAVPDWSLEAMIPEFTKRAVEMIETEAQSKTNPDKPPLFLYFALTSPHSPVCPNKAFRGSSGIGAYGDFVCELDGVVGEITQALERAGATETTLLIFSSDNGAEGRVPDDDDEGAYERVRRSDHYSMGDFRGIKRDAWEGGHRVPFLASWPGKIPAGACCDQVVCLSDLMATCAEITYEKMPARAGEDSVSMWPLLRGNINEPTRDSVVYHSMTGKFAIRRGRWVYIDAPAGNDTIEPDWFRELRGYEPHRLPGELYDLADDPSQLRNRFADFPCVVSDLTRRLNEIKGDTTLTLASNSPDHTLTE